MKKSKVPAGWIKCVLSEHSQIVSGGTPSTKNTEFWSGKIPWITSADIENVNTIKPKRYISESAIKNSTTNLIPKNNIVFVSRVGLGKVAINRFDLCISQDSQGIIFDKNTFDIVYLANYLNVLSQRFIHLNQGSAIKGILKEDLASLGILCPPLTEQKKIAEILSTWDQAIETLDKLIEAKTLLKKGLLQKLLTGNIRLKGFRDKWVETKLGDIAYIDPDNLGINTPAEYQFKYISLEDVDVGILKNYTSQTFAAAPSRARRKIIKGDILVATVRPNLKSHLLFNKNERDWVCSTGFSVVRCKDKISFPGFIFAHLFSENVARQFVMMLTGSNYPAVNSSDVRGLKIQMPVDYAEQIAIAKIFSSLDCELNFLTSIKERLKAQKQGLMQKLLTGKIRVNI